jgi:chromosome segregation ATPase
MAHDDLDHIPAIVPTRDSEPHRASSKTRAGKGAGGSARRPAKPKPAATGGGSGLLARLFITVSLVVAAVACAWAWQLQQQLQQASLEMKNYATRIGDLEDRLSDTDEGMSQSAAVQAVKIGELESEVRKLWDNVWKQTKSRLSKLEAENTTQGKKLASAETSLSTVQSQLKSASGDVAKLKSVAGDLSRLMASAKANQVEVERVADTLNRINLDLAKLNKRVQGNEESVSSINAFRKQVNASLTKLEGSVRALQSAP